MEYEIVWYMIRLCENVVDQLFGDDSMGSRWIHLRLLVQTSVDCVKSRRQITANVKPPIAHEYCLRELCAIRTQEACLATVDVAIVPTCGATFRSDYWCIFNYFFFLLNLGIWCPYQRRIPDTAGHRNRNLYTEWRPELDNRCPVALKRNRDFMNLSNLTDFGPSAFNKLCLF